MDTDDVWEVDEEYLADLEKNEEIPELNSGINALHNLRS